jgi:hypothetical protein
MAIHKRIQIAAGSAVPTAGQQASLPQNLYDKAEHFNQLYRRRPRRQSAPIPPRRNWKRILMMILILIVASFLIYMVLKGSKSSEPVLSASVIPSSKEQVFYFNT